MNLALLINVHPIEVHRLCVLLLFITSLISMFLCVLQHAERIRFIPRSLNEASVRYQTGLHLPQFGPAWHI